MNVIENLKPNQHKTQGFPPPPPSKPRKRKLPENTFLSFLDQIQDGLYGGSILVRNKPKTTKDKHFIVRTFKAEVRSYRRNYSHKSVALYRTKKGGPTRSNIEYMSCSFLEMDGSTNGTIKTLEDVQALARKNNLLEGLQPIETSRGHFHLIWTYSRPLPWTTKGESYWLSQQTKLIKLFQKAGFNVDKMASLNPCQNLRNPSQLNAYNYKRNCKVHIYKTYNKTSLRTIYRALNRTNIQNPKRVQARVKLRRHNRANRTFITTNAELAETLGTSPRTSKREIKRAIKNGDLRIVRRLGNNAGQVRTTQYESLIFIEKFPEVPLVSIKTNSLRETNLLEKFKRVGAKKGLRQKSIFALGLEIKAQLGKEASLEAIRDALKGGARLCHFPVREFERTLRNVMKQTYTHPLSLSKLIAWDLLEEPKHFH